MATPKSITEAFEASNIYWHEVRGRRHKQVHLDFVSKLAWATAGSDFVHAAVSVQRREAQNPRQFRASIFTDRTLVLGDLDLESREQSVRVLSRDSLDAVDVLEAPTEDDNGRLSVALTYPGLEGLLVLGTTDESATAQEGLRALYPSLHGNLTA